MGNLRFPYPYSVQSTKLQMSLLMDWGGGPASALFETRDYRETLQIVGPHFDKGSGCMAAVLVQYLPAGVAPK